MRTHGAEHAATLPVRAAAPEEGDEDGADGGDEEEGRRGAVDMHRAVRLWEAGSTFIQKLIFTLNTWSSKSRKDDSSTRIQIPTPSPAQDKTKIKKFVKNKSHLQQLLKKPIAEADA